MATRTIHQSARCVHCPVPLTKSFGKWVHPWLYVGYCQTPTPVPGSETESS